MIIWDFNLIPYKSEGS